MKLLRRSIFMLAIMLILALAALSVGYLQRSATVAEGIAFNPGASTRSRVNAEARRYRLDASQSKFIAHAMAGGLLWFKGHDHLVAVREFSGEAQFTPEQLNPASLEITARSGSMVETSS